MKLDGVIQDSIGQVGYDPGSHWNSGGVSTMDHTLVRKNLSPDTTVSDTYDPSVNFEQKTLDNYSYLGSPTLVPVELADFTAE